MSASTVFGTYVFIQSSSGLVLDIPSGYAGSAVSLAQKKQGNDNATQLWKFTADGFLEHAKFLVLEIENNGGPGARVIASNKRPDNPAQMWRYDPSSEGILSSHRNLALDGGSISQGAQVIAWDHHRGTNQRWTLVSLSGQPLFPPQQASYTQQPSYSPQPSYPSQLSYPQSNPLPSYSQQPYAPSSQQPYSPSSQPSYAPSSQPSYAPSSQPSYAPSSQPPYMPSSQPPYSGSGNPPYSGSASYQPPTGYNPAYSPSSGPVPTSKYPPSSGGAYTPAPAYPPQAPTGYAPSSAYPPPSAYSPQGPTGYSPATAYSPQQAPQHVNVYPSQSASPAAYSPQPATGYAPAAAYPPGYAPATAYAPSPAPAPAPAPAGYVPQAGYPPTSSPYQPQIVYPSSGVTPVPAYPQRDLSRGPGGQGQFIVSRQSGLVLDIYDNKKNPGAQVIMWEKKNKKNCNQLWRFTQDGFIESVDTGLVLGIEGRRSGGKIIMEHKRSLGDATHQRWRYDPSSEIFTSYDVNVVLDVEGPNNKGNHAVGSPYRQNSPSQKFFFSN